jgi:hypothetical protein
MARRCNKYQTDEIRSRVRDILMHEWDPIGVAGICPADEYDRYISTIYFILSDERTNHRRIANHLLGIATVSMGLSDRPILRERCGLAASGSCRCDWKSHLAHASIVPAGSLTIVEHGIGKLLSSGLGVSRPRDRPSARRRPPARSTDDRRAAAA